MLQCNDLLHHTIGYHVYIGITRIRCIRKLQQKCRKEEEMEDCLLPLREKVTITLSHLRVINAYRM